MERGGQEVPLGTIKRSIEFNRQIDACSEKRERGFFCFGSLRQDVLLSMRDVCSSMRGWRVRERGGEDVLAPLCERCLLIKREGWRMCEVTVAKIGWELPLFLSLCSQLPPFLRAGRKNLLDRAESGTIGWESSHGRRIFAA